MIKDLLKRKEPKEIFVVRTDMSLINPNVTGASENEIPIAVRNTYNGDALTHYREIDDARLDIALRIYEQRVMAAADELVGAFVDIGEAYQAKEQFRSAS